MPAPPRPPTPWPFARSRGVRFCLFFISSFAPRSARNLTILSAPRFAALCNAAIVMPPEHRLLQTSIRVRAMRQQYFYNIRGIEFIDQLGCGAAQHGAERVHIDGGVERGHSGFIADIGIRAFFEQHRGEVE